MVNIDNFFKTYLPLSIFDLVFASLANVDRARFGIIKRDAEVVNDRLATSTRNKMDIRSSFRTNVGVNRLVIVNNELAVGDDRLAIGDNWLTINNNKLAAGIGKRTDVEDGSDAWANYQSGCWTWYIKRY